MSRRLKYFSLAGVSLLAAIFIIASAFTRMVFVNDYIESVFIRVFSLYETPGGGSTVISGNNYRKYIKTYSKMPEGMFHFANMLFYKGNKNVKPGDLSSSAIEFTDYYKLYSLKQDILSKNMINQNIINSGELILIEKSLPPFITDSRGNRTGNIKFTRGLYFSGDNAGGESFISKLPGLKAIGINAIVFDVKDITGIVHVKSRVKEVRDLNLAGQGAIDNLPKLIRECRENGIYIIARIAVFHDQLLWSTDPTSRIKSRSTGRDWNPGSHEMWVDPSNRKVQDYNIALAVELAEAGVDEVQFDYIRFPTLGDQGDADFVYSDGKMERTEVISRFLKRAHEAVGRAGAFLSIDVFGVVAWGKDVDIKTTGQQIALLAQHCDVISPMLYPSHFNDNFDGFKNPGDHPYHFILDGCRKVIELSGGKVIVRPWLQAFGWRVSNFNAAYITEQVRGSNDSGSHGYLFWNASNKYNEVFQSMGK
jgi:hypothetical protein